MNTISQEERDRLILALGYLVIVHNEQDSERREYFRHLVLKPIEDVTGYKLPEVMLK